MSRTISQIQQQIIQEKNTHAELNGLNSPSQTSIWNLWTYIIAVAIYVQEGLWDIFQSNLEVQIAQSPAWTNGWVQSQAFKFQYDSSNAQVIDLVNFVPTYPIVDTSKQIISRCSVKTLPSRVVSIKVATANPPQALDSLELTSFQAYLSDISPAGVQYNAVSLAADELLVGATIYYNGQYAPSIKSLVINAIDTYLANLPFDGFIRVSSLEEAILNVQGVNDVVMNDVAIRASVTPFINTTYLVQNNAEIFPKYPMFAGYAIPETTATHTLNDTLTFIIG